MISEFLKRYSLNACGGLIATSVLLGATQVRAQASPIIQVATGFFHACALEESGQVWCWGDNRYGQLGDGTREARVSPVAVLRIRNAVQISAGREHTCALRRNGRVSCWGRNDEGQLGDRTTRSRNRPVLVASINNATQVSTGDNHSCAVRATGWVFCWGGNDFGQLGNGLDASRSSPVRVQGITDAAQVSAGENYSCARLETGSVECWGDGSFGRLGTGGRSGSFVPQPVRSMRNASEVHTGSGTTCALRENGRVACWGANILGTQGNGTISGSEFPVRGMIRISNASDLSTRFGHTCVVRGPGRVFCAGSNLFGELGIGETGEIQANPVPVLRLSDATQVAVGRNFSCALRSTARVVCWGANDRGQLGDGTTSSRAIRGPVAFQ